VLAKLHADTTGAIANVNLTPQQIAARCAEAMWANDDASP